MSTAAGEPAYDIAEILPRQGEWSESDYLRLTENVNRLVELNDGMVEVLRTPTREHQLVLGRLSDLFRAFAARIGGLALFAPLRLRVRPSKFREPDLIFLRDRADPRAESAFFTGADLVVEVLSPNDPLRDTVTKRNEYAQAGIPEYWLVDPEARDIVVLELAGEVYREVGRFSGANDVRSVLLAELRTTAADMFVDLD